MSKRAPGSMRARQCISDLIEGRLSSPDGRAELVRLATRLIVEEALEAESRDALGREYYEHGAQPGQDYRNGSRPGRLKTAVGLIDYAAPQIADRDEPFRSHIRDHLKGRTQVLEDLSVEAHTEKSDPEPSYRASRRFVRSRMKSGHGVRKSIEIAWVPPAT